MKDLLNNELRTNDVVVYVYQNVNGKLETKQGVVVGFNGKGAKVETQQGLVNARNVIKIGRKRFNLFQFTKVLK